MGNLVIKLLDIYVISCVYQMWRGSKEISGWLRSWRNDRCWCWHEENTHMLQNYQG